MKKILLFTFMFVALALTAQQADRTTNATFSNPSNGNENAWYSDTNYIVANDFEVLANQKFMLRKINANIWVSTGVNVSSVDVHYYADNAGLPGTEIGTLSGLTPLSQDVITNTGAYDVKNLEVAVNSFVFEAGSSNTTFWIGLTVNADDGLHTGWESTSATMQGNPMALQNNGGGFTYVGAGNLDGVYTFSGYYLDACEQFHPGENGFEEGWGVDANEGWLTANDLTVTPSKNYLLTAINTNIWVPSGESITNVDVIYYDDDNGKPGTQIGFETGVTVVSQDVIGHHSVYDIKELKLDVTPFRFDGQVGVYKTYWIALSVTASNNAHSYWGVTNNIVTTGHATWFNNNGAGWIEKTGQDGVYIFTGDCQGLGVADNIIDGFSMYPNPAQDVLHITTDNPLQSVRIYNMLGQEVIRTTKATIDVSKLTAGSYMLKVQAGEQIGAYHFIKK